MPAGGGSQSRSLAKQENPVSDSVIQPSISPADLLTPAKPPATDTSVIGHGPTPPPDLSRAMLQGDHLAGPVRDRKGRAKANVSLDAPGEPVLPGKAKQDDGWKVHAYFGFNRTKYYNSDVSIRSPLLNVDIKDMEWKERTSADFYNPKNWKTVQNAFQWIDEPTNTFVLSATKNKNEFMLTAFHPKYLINPGQQKDVHGDVNGVPVEGVHYLQEPFDGYNRQPGELYMTDIRNTHMQMDFQVGYGREFELFRTPKNSSLVYRPAVYAGVQMGKTVSIYEKDYWTFDGYEDKTRVHGVSASIGNKLEYRFRDRVSVMAEYKLSGAMLNQKVYGGTAKYNMLYSPLMVGVGVKLYDENKHR
jgi:hypothetical protein